MDLQNSKIELVKLILEIDSQEMIDNLRKLLSTDEKDFWTVLSEKEKESIRIGLSQLDRGEGTPLSDFIKKVS
jgi:hypothetical protein